MHIATPTQEDIDQTIKLWCVLREVFDNEMLPIDEEPECFDENNQKHLRILYEKLKQSFCGRPSAITRVLWGMIAIWDSGYIDKDNKQLTLKIKE